ncbi:MAG: hypothetical protein IT427_18205 [Pirellulales bacterium]|nr:hypothetical protein [Pirellulales bacterium]
MLRQPLISIELDGPASQGREQHFRPGDVLAGAYQIDAVEAGEIKAVEISVLWFTEGKGDEDLAVHYFERLSAGDLPEMDLSELRRFQTVLPRSPLSYEGVLVKICWCVRVRAFLNSGRNFVFEKAFQLGDVPVGDEVLAATSSRGGTVAIE